MSVQDVVDAVQDRDSHHRQLAALAIDLGVVAHGLIQFEPSTRNRRTLQHHAVDIQESAATGTANFGDEVGQLGMIVFVDQGYSCHEFPLGEIVFDLSVSQRI